MKRLSDLASPKVIRASLPSDEDDLLGERVKVNGQRGIVDMVTTEQGKRRYHINGDDGQQIGNVDKDDIFVVKDGQK